MKDILTNYLQNRKVKRVNFLLYEGCFLTLPSSPQERSRRRAQSLQGEHAAHLSCALMLRILFLRGRWLKESRGPFSQLLPDKGKDLFFPSTMRGHQRFVGSLLRRYRSISASISLFILDLILLIVLLLLSF